MLEAFGVQLEPLEVAQQLGRHLLELDPQVSQTSAVVRKLCGLHLLVAGRKDRATDEVELELEVPLACLPAEPRASNR